MSGICINVTPPSPSLVSFIHCRASRSQILDAAGANEMFIRARMYKSNFRRATLVPLLRQRTRFGGASFN